MFTAKVSTQGYEFNEGFDLTLDLEGTELKLSVGTGDDNALKASIYAKNEESLLEIINNIECRTELLKYINENITSEQRDSNEQEAFERDVKKIVARGALLDNALNEFSSRKPAKVKKEWITSEIDGGLRIDKYNGTDVVIVIPSVIEEKTVIEIAADAMRASTSAEDGRKSAYNKKMYKNKAIIILDGITVIGENAFSGCVYMTDICLPESVTLIAKNAFEACHKLTIHAPATSYAEQYALEHNIPFIAE